MFKDDPYCASALLVNIVFFYLSGMTYAFLTRTFLTNPGYLPKWLKVPKIEIGAEPKNLVRVYNLRHWIANKIHLHDEFLEPADGIDMDG
mmetsp:Transcript_155/g.219  ORF Transcript_155/g.219 Transcript_155/m.219 type:complete len:90 (+) Transcript_155:154-423(+)